MASSRTDSERADAGLSVRLVPASDPAHLSAMALVLTGQPRVTADVRAQMHSLFGLALNQKLCLDLLLGAFAPFGLVSAVLLLESPGRSGLVYPPPGDFSSGESSALVRLLEDVARRAGARGVRLLQALLPAEDRQRPAIFARCGYRFLAELIYMDRAAVEADLAFEAPGDLETRTYRPKVRHLFTRALEASYIESLDCPGLSGLRRTNDILAGHIATGVYDPSGWLVALRGGEPVGVLITARLPNRSALEVVYVGVAPTARGGGLGDFLMGRAMALARRQGLDVVTLAVDGTNEPARRFYQRWGFIETARRRAWIHCVDDDVSEPKREGGCGD